MFFKASNLLEIQKKKRPSEAPRLQTAAQFQRTYSQIEFEWLSWERTLLIKHIISE